MTESAIVAEVLIAVSRLPQTMVWRHNSGKLPDANGRWISFGLVGSGDIIGTHRGWAIAIECKTRSGRLALEQQRFRLAWMRAGGAYIVARSAEDALRGLAALDATGSAAARK